MNIKYQRVAVVVYITMMIFTFGHASANFKKDELASELSALMGWALWPLYWSYELQRDGE